ncbi:MAG: hypothetical protein ACAH80_07880, partial [Alphaproteobacteria bacterium]
SVAFPASSSRPRRSVVCEQLAEIAAMEFLYPFKYRMYDAQQKSIDYHHIAKHYRIPQVYVEEYLDPQVMKTLGAFQIHSVAATGGAAA